MLKRTEVKDLNCIEYNQLIGAESVEKYFFAEPDKIVYVLENERLAGIITLGDFKRNMSDIRAGINRQSKKLTISNDVDLEAERIFSENPQIKKIPVVDEKGEFLFEMTYENTDFEKEKIDYTKYLKDTTWFFFYLQRGGCKRVCLIDYNGFAQEFLKNIEVEKPDICIDVISADDFSRGCFMKYDLVIDTDLRRYERRHELYRRMDKRYTNTYTSIEQVYFLHEIVTQYKRHKENGVRFYVFEAPSETKLKYMTEKQKDRLKNKRFWKYYYKQPQLYADELKEMFGKDDFMPMVNNLFKMPVPIRKADVISYEEYRSDYCNVTGGYRITLNKEWENYTQDIDIYGPCSVFGLFVEDKDTISSVLQDEINHSDMNFFNVNNFGLRTASVQEMLKCMCNKDYQKGDIVIFMMMHEEIEYFHLIDPELSFIELSTLCNDKAKELGVFFLDNPVHFNYRASRVIAKEMYRIVYEEYRSGLISKVSPFEKRELARKKNIKEAYMGNAELIKYISEITKYKADVSGRVGSIVMNCNPFTNGHRFLIEQAAMEVDQLFIFVVEENKSVFSFLDRIELVKQGTKDLENVVVLPSGKFIISTVTFPEYFQKDDKQEVAIDMSLDIEVFAQCIAPEMNITIRFVGEEPIDKVTQQYNKTMQRILPQYGIECKEIKRIELSNVGVISASKVRKYLQEGEWEQIKRMVPTTTYDYLLDRFK